MSYEFALTSAAVALEIEDGVIREARIGLGGVGSRRSPEPRSLRDGHWLVGYGMAGLSYPWWQAPAKHGSR